MESKYVWASKTVWGALAVVAVSIASIAGYDIGSADGWSTDIVQLLGAALAIFGRAKASKKLKLLP